MNPIGFEMINAQPAAGVGPSEAEDPNVSSGSTMMPPPPPAPIGFEAIHDQEPLGNPSDAVSVNMPEEEEASLYLEDGHRRIDFMLVFTEDADGKTEGKKKIWRENFENSLKKEGLETEVSVREITCPMHLLSV